MKLERFGESAVGIRITGNPKNCEPPHIRIRFPGGHVEVTRAAEGVVPADYWVHVYVNNPHDKSHCSDPEVNGPDAAIIDARLDQTDKSSDESNIGDFNRAELYHVAVRVTHDPKKFPKRKAGAART